MKGNIMSAKSFKESLRDLECEFNRQSSEIDALRTRLQNYRKDDEIQQLKAEIQNIRKLNLLNMTLAERDAVDTFVSIHLHKCQSPSFSYELSGTSIATAITIRCPICGEEKDVTDYEAW